MASSLLLPVPLASNSVLLGQLLSNPLSPSSLSFVSPSVPTPPREIFLQSRYKDVVSHDDDGRLLSRLAEPSLAPSEDNILLVQADEMEHLSLKRASTSFDILRQDTAAQTFLRKMALRNQPLYYVVGIQKLKNPTFKRAVVKEGEVNERLSSKVRLPMHVRRDSGMALQEDSSTDVVFGIEVRKVKASVGSADEPHVLEDIDYSWTYHMLDVEKELQLSIGLGEPLEAAELRVLAGIVSHEDFTDESYNSDESEGDGLAGF